MVSRRATGVGQIVESGQDFVEDAATLITGWMGHFFDAATAT